MASKTISPTRMELTRLKGRLKTAVRGHKLLKDKRDEMMRQFLDAVRRNRALREKVEQGLAEASVSMAAAGAVMSPDVLRQALLCPRQKVSVELDSAELDKMVGEDDAQKLRDDLEIIEGVYPEFSRQTYLDAEVAPVFFGSALNNFGVKELLDCFVEIAPSPRPTKAEERDVQPEEPKFTGFIFKITANIDPNHRSCIAFCKVCSGKFVRNAPYLHVRQGKTVRFSSPTQFMAQRKSTIDEAWPGDIVGLPDNGIFKIGDTLTEGEQLHFRGLPSFSPEMFKYIENADPMKTKQLEKGINQLMDEGEAQLFINQFNGRKLIGTVGQLQFEVIQYRLENEYGAKCRWEPASLYKACWIESDDAAQLEAFKKRKYQYMARDLEGRDVFLADSGYVLQMAQQDFEHIRFHFTSEF